MQTIKKILTFFTLIFVLLSNLQIGVLYADSASKLEIEKTKSVEKLEKVEKLIGTVVKKIDKKIKNKEIKERLEEKNEEVKEYLEKVQEQIEDETSRRDVKKIAIEARKVVVLKVISGVTKQTDLSEEISIEVASNPKEKKEALETIQDSLEQ